MKEIKTNELKKIQVEILDAVHCFCKENNISYWLDCGTLLGAIRHKGYIPWDDDIDIGMMRDDYDVFCKTFNGRYKNFEVVCIENKPGFYVPFAKVMDKRTILIEEGHTLSVNIDLFVYDNAPDNEIAVKKMFDKRDFYNKFRIAQLYPDLYDKSSLLKKIMRFFLNIYLKFLPKNYYTKKCIKNSKKYMNKDTKRVGNFTSAKRMTGNKEIFNSFTEVTFEKKKYPAPVGYDDWLKAFYGDYMKLPPEEKRVSNHKFKAYYIGDNDEK